MNITEPSLRERNRVVLPRIGADSRRQHMTVVFVYCLAMISQKERRGMDDLT